MVDPKQTVGELFSGPGGMGYGLLQAGIHPLWALDNDLEACRTYRLNVGDHAICQNIETVDFSRLPAPDGLAFGFPCNDFSQVGEQKGLEGYFGGLYKHAKRALDVIKPTWFIAENVPGMLKNGAKHVLGEFAGAGPGYRVAVHMYKFERYGVPQRRHRVIAVGIRSDADSTFSPPAPTHGGHDGEPIITAKEALEGAESVEHNNRKTRHPQHVIDRLKHIPPGENAWHPDVPEHLQLNVEACRLSVIYRRLHPDEPSYTVTGSGGGGTHMYHFDEPRALTNRERARLQAFPDTFIFKGTKEGIRRQIGMAVPPVAAEHIGRALLASISGAEYPFVEPSIGMLGPDAGRPAQLELVSGQEAADADYEPRRAAQR